MNHAAMSSMPAMSPEMQAYIDECLTCHRVCLGEAMNHCLTMGGKHLEPDHFRTMINCAEMCQTSANFMLSGSPLHTKTCGVCAEICETCAESCQQVGDMDECVQQCRKCAESCRKMASTA